MSPLIVRHTYWNISCAQRNLAAGINTLKKAFNAAGTGTPTVAGPSFPFSNWHEFKVGTYQGQKVLLVVEVTEQAAVDSFQLYPSLKKLVIHQRSYTFQPDRGLKKYTYLLFGYIPFRSQTYHSYQQSRTLTEKNMLLRQHLTYHLNTLAARLAWPMRTPLQLDEMKLRQEKKDRLGGLLHVSFDLEFTTNLFIPEFLGVGKGAGVGAGVVRRGRGVRVSE